MAKNRQIRKAQRTRVQTGRDEVAETPAPLSGSVWGHVGIIVQSFAVFVAISTLLGRIYSLTYFRALGIPTSEIRLSVTDYSVVSPEVTIFGVGFSIIVAILLWSDGMEALTIVPRRARFLAGSICLFGAIAIPAYVVLSSRQPDLDSVWLTILMLLVFALGSFGGGFLSSGFFPDAQGTDQEIVLRKAIMPLLVIIVVGFGIWIASEFSSIMGKVDAEITWETAPQARIELASSGPHESLRYDPDECDSDSARCRFRVVLIGDKFVYLRPLDPELSEERLYAVPIEDIATINYLFERNAQ